MVQALILCMLLSLGARTGAEMLLSTRAIMAMEKTPPKGMMKRVRNINMYDANMEKSKDVMNARELFFWIKSKAPSASPTTLSPTQSPTPPPTPQPTKQPTPAPTPNPTDAPSSEPTKEQKKKSAKGDTEAPTKSPTNSPSKLPTKLPTKSPSKSPTKAPSNGPTEAPSKSPTQSPTQTPTASPTKAPSVHPTAKPTNTPTAHVDDDTHSSTQPPSHPTKSPASPPAPPSTSNDDTPAPTLSPSASPTALPSLSISPSLSPTAPPSALPTASPTKAPSIPLQDQPTPNTQTSIPTSSPTAPPPTPPTTQETKNTPACNQQLTQNQITSSLPATLSIQYQVYTNTNPTNEITSLQKDIQSQISNSVLRCNLSTRRVLGRVLRLLQQLLGMDYASQSSIKPCTNNPALSSSSSASSFPYCTDVTQEVTMYLHEDTPTKDLLSIVNDALSDVESAFTKKEEEEKEYGVVFVRGEILDIAGMNMDDVEDKSGLNTPPPNSDDGNNNDGNNVNVAAAKQGALNTTDESNAGFPPLAMGLTVGTVICAFIIAGLVLRRRKKRNQTNSFGVPLSDGDNTNAKHKKKHSSSGEYESRIDPSWTTQHSSSNPSDGENGEDDLNTTFSSASSLSPKKPRCEKFPLARICNEEEEDREYYKSDVETTSTSPCSKTTQSSSRLQRNTITVKQGTIKEEGEGEEIEMTISDLSTPYIATDVHECVSSNCVTCRSSSVGGRRPQPVFHQVEYVSDEMSLANVSVLSSRVSSRESRSYTASDTVDL